MFSKTIFVSQFELRVEVKSQKNDLIWLRFKLDKNLDKNNWLNWLTTYWVGCIRFPLEFFVWLFCMTFFGWVF